MTQKRLKLSWLLLGSLIASTGTSFIWPLTTVYMHDYLHQTLTLAGIVLFVESVLMIGGSYLGGYIYDHFNYRPWLLGSIGASLISMFLLIFFNGWPLYPLLLLVNGFGGAIANTIINALATTIKHHDAAYVFNMMYFAANCGVVLGTFIVGFVVKYNIRYVFVVTFILFVFFWLIAQRHYRVPRKVAVPEKTAATDPLLPKKTPVFAVWIVCGLLLAYLMIELGYSQWQSNLAVYMQSLGIGLNKYSYLWTINGIIIVIGQPLINYLELHFEINGYHKVYGGFLLFILGFGSLIFAKDYPHFILSMVIVTLGEVIAFPTIPALVASLSSEAEKGKYQGFVSISASLGHAIGPLLGGVVIEFASYEVLFEGLTFLIVIAGVLSMIITWFKKI
ncbi:MDR family MFS transporter [Liquorilactobacillus satsumensis]|uniref:MFS transporter n=1 Tax=Liquorilactobacillus satsumensis DSM 16230 = JCM 12392 TaxID=1423801 RepID=A0A0R1UV29_9LACO|nr:MFS transporter [Liquorilactobacillus satsumensis]KRL96919.1 MFS transporter [Liquorilactobacillus satsumensis DSM 16230 = JCM 12392]MCC7667808.1 MFS transporter [Liquorilactobacillus satsumensis]MCP9312431.1 MFS transporter [Liquorilactobacillus satsumensis]MCP9358560.1 MFS transporter [Liquorilactobacillus satsumensis]MCP9359720.1 MFS transporter [Liquorilactobacillus satsumensis]